MYLITTTQRVASSYLQRILHCVTKLPEPYLDATACGFSLFDPTPDNAIERVAQRIEETGSAIYKTHDIGTKDFPRLCARLPELKVLTISRDFEDVVVSRFHYYRYFWHAKRELGEFPDHLKPVFEKYNTMDDATALNDLVNTQLVRDWAAEWVAFEGPFDETKNVIRLRYTHFEFGFLNHLWSFLGLDAPAKLPTFSEIQATEKANTGRDGNSRFHRRGRSGEAQEVFATESLWRLRAIAYDAFAETLVDAAHSGEIAG